MKCSVVSAHRGKNFAARPEFRPVAVARKTFDRNVTQHAEGPRYTKISLARVAWLERDDREARP
jgi:hypothetical protein